VSASGAADGAAEVSRELPERIASRRMDSILESAATAREIVAHGRTEWDRNVLLRLASEAVVIRIGEAVKAIPRDHLPEASDISWKHLATTRDFYAHNQHKINPEALWGELTREVPRVERAVRQWRDGQQRGTGPTRRPIDRAPETRTSGRGR